MIEVQKIADFLNTELNNIGKSQGYNFDIKAEVGERTNEDAIYGIVSTTKADARVDENVDYVFTVELSVPSAKTNENIICVETIIGEFKNKFHMKNRAFGGGQGTLSISLATPKDYQIKYVVGDDVPLVFTISTSYIRNAVGSGDKHWFLNGMEIPFIKENLLVEKNGRINSIHGKKYTETLLTQQTRYYKFNFDYDNSELCIMLKKDLLNGKYDKVYTLTYYDGVSFTEEEPFTTSVSIFRNGISGSTKPNVSEFDITFTDVDNETEAEYYIALIDNPFDRTTENTRYFKSQEEQKIYYQEKIDNDIRVGGVGCQFVKIKAPNLSGINITNQVYEIPLHEDKPIYDILSVTNKNYAIIKVKKDEEEQWFYYYVSNQNIGGQNQVMFDLQIDSLQTYYFDPKLQFGDCLIERGHENRWIDNGDGTVSFDGTIDSRLFEREEIQNVAKRLIKRQVLKPYTFDNLEIQQWFDDNILGWAYVFVDPFHDFNVTNPNGEDIKDYRISAATMHYGNASEEQTTQQWDSMPDQLGIACYPIYKTTQQSTLTRIKFVAGDNVLRINHIGMNDFFQRNNGNSFVYSIKFSTVNPFAQINSSDLYIQNGELHIPSTALYYHWAHGSLPNYDMYAAKTGGTGGIIILQFQQTKQMREYLISKELTFNHNDIINSQKKSKYNPKFLSGDYFDLKISDETEDGFAYDVQKLKTNKINIAYTEPLIAGISKKYIRILPTNNEGVYIEDTAKNFTGFIGSNDASFNLATTAYQSMLANNKNFFLQNSINRGVDIAKNMIGTGTSYGQSTISAQTSKNPDLTMASAGITVAQSAVNMGLNYAQSKINENLTVDNVRFSPSKIQLAQGDILFNTMITDTGIVVEEWDILPNEKEIINDYMCKYGFTVNRFGNPKDYDNIRHYYNYVKAQIDSISGIAISNSARDDIRQRFANGVRFWNSDNVDYSMENYEEWLENASTVNKAEIRWSANVFDNVVAEYQGQEYTEWFETNSNDTVTFKCSSNRSIKITNIQSDGTVEMTKTNSYTAVLTYTGATYVTMDIDVYDIA